MDVDCLAGSLARWGRVAHSLPAGTWLEAGHTTPLLSGGQKIGSIVPGRGLLLDADLRALGITKPIPHVFERSPWARWTEKLLDCRGSITGLADVLNGQNRQLFSYTDQFRAAIAGYTGQQFDAIASPVTFTNFTTGTGIITSALNRTFCAGAYNAALADPPAGAKKYLLGLSMMYGAGAGSGFGMGVYVDILCAVGGLAADSTSLQTFSSAALTRYTSGVGVYYAVCGSNNTGATPTSPSTCTVGYTNSAGTSGRSASFVYDDIVGSALLAVWDATLSVENTTLAHPLQAGDAGVQSIQSLQVSVVTGVTAGTKLGILIYRPLYFIGSITDQNTTMERDLRTEPECLVELAVDAGGVLGYHSLIWCNGTGTTTTTNMFTGIACEV